MRDPRIDGIQRSLARDAERRGAGPADAPIDRTGTPLADLRLLASVALLVRPRPSDLEVLLIRRAAFAGDPWSGHVALPGGRRAPIDRSGVDTAVREALEEVGIDVRAVGAELGRLEDVRPRRGAPVIRVSPYVFAVPDGTPMTLNHEVDSALWVPARHLADPASEIEHLHTLATGEHKSFPAIGYKEFVIWGLTHQILSRFFEMTRTAG